MFCTNCCKDTVFQKLVSEETFRVKDIPIVVQVPYLKCSMCGDMIKKPKVKDYLDSLIATYKIYGKLRLFCWCAPKRCHGETIKRYLEDLSE